jgi:acyl-CoA thioester hydrolase
MENEATYRGTVYPWQCDHVGHMNIMWYVGKFDEANWNLFARLGLTPTYLRESAAWPPCSRTSVTSASCWPATSSR